MYFYILNMKYTSRILLEIFWFPKLVTLKKKKKLNLYVSGILWVHQEFSNELYLKYTLNNFLKCICISFLGHKYTRSRLSKLANLHSKLEAYLEYAFWIDAFFWNLEVYLKWTFYIYVFNKFKLRSIIQVDFLNNLFSNSIVYSK